MTKEKIEREGKESFKLHVFIFVLSICFNLIWCFEHRKPNDVLKFQGRKLSIWDTKFSVGIIKTVTFAYTEHSHLF